MTETEVFWLSVVDELDDPEVEAISDVAARLVGETPLWVVKLGAELLTMLMPRLQLRLGDRPTPEKVGAMVVSQLESLEGILAAMSANAAQTEKIYTALNFVKPILGGFDSVAAVGATPRLRKRFYTALAACLPRILERPNEERYRFFRALAQGLRPEKVSTKGKELTAAQTRQLNSIVVYGVTLLNWEKFERFTTSRQAYEFLVKLLSVDIVGHDPERVRRMFARAGKQFRPPGRPPKG